MSVFLFLLFIGLLTFGLVVWTLKPEWIYRFLLNPMLRIILWILRMFKYFITGGGG